MPKNYDQNNVFAKIIRGEIPSQKVYEDDKILAFYDISKAAPTHVLVVPKAEYIAFADFIDKAESIEIANFFGKVKEIASQIGLDENGYRLITNNGSDASQTVPHFHVHILGGKKLGGLLPKDKLER